MKCKKRLMLLLMIYVDDTHKALTNKATVPRVRHRAIKFKTLPVTSTKQKSHYWVTKEIGIKSFAVQLLSPPSAGVDPTVKFRLFNIVFNGIHS